MKKVMDKIQIHTATGRPGLEPGGMWPGHLRLLKSAACGQISHLVSLACQVTYIGGIASIGSYVQAMKSKTNGMLMS